jgi:S1-C subfamily serine protease
MHEKEIEDYIKTQRSLGVNNQVIKKSLLDAGYQEENFRHLLEKHAKAHSRAPFNMTTRHIVYLNIGVIIIFGFMLAFISYDYNTKLNDLTIAQQALANTTDTKLATQSASLSSLRVQTEAKQRELSSDIDSTESRIDSVKTDLDTKIQTYNYASLKRDSSLSDSIQKSSNQSLTELSDFSQELDRFRDASVDFSTVIPVAVEAVVTIGTKGTVFFSTAGSGVFINDKGYIVTNHHVVENLRKITVKTHDDKDYRATIIGKDEAWDIAVLKLDTKRQNFTNLGWADSGQVEVGDHVIAVGNPVGFESTVTEGIISNTKRLITGDAYIYYFQTDVAINAGNSGGPLIDKDGKIVGINTLKFSKAGYEGLSFALRANDVQRIVLEILKEEAGTS